jgi:diadenosine tetraphosphate (Ap4A) HIT family hydrolase
MANETIVKFGYPETLIREYNDWVVLLRPAQVTIGSLVLACKLDVDSMGQVPSAAFTELATITSDIESSLGEVFQNDKINYLLLMMVDKHVHFHVLPRYASARSLKGTDFEDTSWPGPPDVTKSLNVTSDQFDEMLATLKAAWPE